MSVYNSLRVLAFECTFFLINYSLNYQKEQEQRMINTGQLHLGFPKFKA